MRLPLLIALALVSLPAAAVAQATADPALEPTFVIAGSDAKGTLIFVSGLSYGISTLNKAYENAGVRVGICLGDGQQYVGVREIVGILNKDGKKTYAAEDATSIVVSALARNHPCR